VLPTPSGMSGLAAREQALAARLCVEALEQKAAIQNVDVKEAKYGWNHDQRAETPRDALLLRVRTLHAEPCTLLTGQFLSSGSSVRYPDLGSIDTDFYSVLGCTGSNVAR